MCTIKILLFPYALLPYNPLSFFFSRHLRTRDLNPIPKGPFESEWLTATTSFFRIILVDDCGDSFGTLPTAQNSVKGTP